jgi:membrane protease YdiL (CAAX protease family)
MSDLVRASPPISAPSAPPRAWGFLETTLVALIADGVLMLTGGFALVLLLWVYGGTRGLSATEFEAMWPQGRWQGASIIVAALPTIALLWVAIRMAGGEFAEYLALNWPTKRELLLAFGVTAIVVLAESFVASLVGARLPITDSYRVVGGPGSLLALLVGGCIAGPIVQEFIVRGFMFRGWSQSSLGPVGAIVLTAPDGMGHEPCAI